MKAYIKVYGSELQVNG